MIKKILGYLPCWGLFWVGHWLSLIFELAGDGEHAKVGYSKNPQNRLKDLQTSNPRELKMFARFAYQTMTEAQRAEKALHKKYREYKLRGEWFAKEMLDLIRSKPPKEPFMGRSI